MTTERREAASPNQAGGGENPATVSQQTTDFTPDPAAGPPAAPAPPGAVPAPPAAFGRYLVRRTLGAGGCGAVYLGDDPQLGRPVAIKVLRGEAGCAHAEGEQALQEARRLAQLRHPGIVAVHDVGMQEGQVYIVSDYLDGPDLCRWLRDNRPSWRDSARIAAAVADALAHAHAQLVVHRDVKPANILLTAGGAPVLVDFGLALDEAQAGGGAKGVVAGTPGYMSPEQAAGVAHRLDGRTDIYSLGVVLYEMLAGRAPFRATNPQELLRQVCDDEPQPPRQLVGDIPPELERACLKALAKRQQDRYTTAGDFAADLCRALQTTADVSGSGLVPVGTPATESRAATPATPWPGTLSPVASQAEWTGPQPGWSASPPISPVQRHSVGRQKELAELGRAFESAAAGQGLFLCVTGEPGIGKTTLLDDFLGELSATGRPCALARGRCSERLAGTEAYLPFLEALESLLHGEGGEAAARVMKATAPNWYAQVVSLTTEDSSLTRLLAESKAASQERLKRELGAFLRDVSHLRPLLLFIDDLHWADASTVDLLAYLGGKCAGMRALLVLTYRPTDLVLGKHPWGPVKLDLQARGVCHELALELLTRADLDRYLALEFPGHGFPEEFAALVHARTEGSPLFMADLLRYLRDRQVLTQEQGRWTLRESVPDLQRHLPESVRGMIQRKIDQLGEDDRRLLVAASVQGYEFDSAVVAGVLERDAADVEDRLDELDRVHAFVRPVREQEFPDRTLTLRYRFVHVLYQNALYASLRPTRRAALSASVAQALLGFYGESSSDVASELASLFETARDFARAAEHCLLAAQSAARVFASHEVVVLAHRGLELLKMLPDNHARSQLELRLQITLGTALMATKGQGAPDVERAFLRARDLCQHLGETSELFRVLWGLWYCFLVRAEIQKAHQFSEQLFALAQGQQDPTLLLLAHRVRGQTLFHLGELAHAQAVLGQGIALYDPQLHSALASLYGQDPGVVCRSWEALALWLLGYPDRAAQRSREALALAQGLPHSYTRAYALEFAAWFHHFRREEQQTQEFAEAATGLCQEQGFMAFVVWGTIWRGWALTTRGEEGIAQMWQGLAGWRALGGELWRPTLLALLADAYGKAGRSAKALAVLAEALALANKNGERPYEAELYRLKGEFLLASPTENQAEAEACFRQAIAIARRQSAKSLELRAVMSLSRLYQKQGKQAEARPMLAEIYGWFTEGLDTADLVEAAAQLTSLA
jgi:serine/threonine protein kinase/predicted ATPase